MPVTIKTVPMEYRDSNGQYKGINAVAERATTEQVSEIGTAGANQISAIEAKGAETRASIPSDYTALSDEVTDLKGALDFKLPYSKQLFDSSTCTDGYLINPANGQPLAFNGYSCSDFIPALSESYIYHNSWSTSLSGSRGLCYDIDKVYLGQVEIIDNTKGLVKTLSGTAYIRMTVPTSDKSIKFVYIMTKVYGNPVKEYESIGYADFMIQDLFDIGNEKYAPITMQVFDPSGCTDGYNISSTGGAIVSQEGYSVSDYIPIGENEYYYHNNWQDNVNGTKGYCYSDTFVGLGVAQVKISKNGLSVFKTLSGTSFIRLSVQTSDKESTLVYINGRPGADFEKSFGTKLFPDDFETERIPMLTQLFDKTQCTDGYLIGSNGNLIEFSGYSVSDYIPIRENEYYYRNCWNANTSGSRGVCFTKDGTCLGYSDVIENEDIGKFKTKPNTAYVRFTIPTADKNIAAVYAGYCPGGEFSRPYGEKAAPDWVDCGNKTTVNKTINNYADAFTNTYNIDTNPTITTDSHGWLESVDTNTQSESGKTDMTGAILSMLTDTGYCHLGEGIFYVSGSIDMPEGSLIEGCGNKTIVRLLSSVQQGYVLKPASKCTIRDLTLSGGYSAPTISASDPVGNRHGIYFKGNADGKESGTIPSEVIVDGVRIYNFAGGGITCHNTGYSHASSLYATNCMIGLCHAGINIDYFSEYNRFTNIMIYDCHYACVNNGGNNIFNACTFQGLVGFVIDNSENDKPNSAHGSCVGCSFNHQNSNNGNAVEIYGAPHEFTFTGCQFWYGHIFIENSSGIIFSSSNFSQSENITINGGGAVVFIGNTFKGIPTITITNNTVVKFDSNYDVNGIAITAS